MFKRFFFLVTLCCLANFAFAKQYICATNAGVAYPNDKTVLNCSGGLGENVKLSAMLDKGYRIITLSQSQNVHSSYEFISGEKVKTESYWVIVLEK